MSGRGNEAKPSFSDPTLWVGQLREMLHHPKPGDRWPYEPPAPPDDGSGTAGDREPSGPRNPDGGSAALPQHDPAEDS